MNVGGAPVRSRAGLVTTVGWSLNGETTFVIKAADAHGFYLVELSNESLKTTRFGLRSRQQKKNKNNIQQGQI